MRANVKYIVFSQDQQMIKIYFIHGLHCIPTFLVSGSHYVARLYLWHFSSTVQTTTFIKMFLKLEVDSYSFDDSNLKMIANDI